MKRIFYKLKEFWLKSLFYIRCRIHNLLFNRSLKSKDCLNLARRSDVSGNYDLDGASFDGNQIYINGKLI